MTFITDKDGQKLLMQVADLLELNPELHEQQSWESECGTKACIAGWLCILGTDDFEYIKGMNVPKQETVDAAVAAMDESDRRELLKDINDPSFEYKDDPEKARVFALAASGYFGKKASELLGGRPDFGMYHTMFAATCRPQNGLSVAEAMREIARGTEIESVWRAGFVWQEEWDDDVEEPLPS